MRPRSLPPNLAASNWINRWNPKHSNVACEGEQAVLRNTADERCSITLARRNGKVGIEVELSGPGWDGKRNSPKPTNSSMNPPTNPSTNPRFEKFLAAE